jgi:hypothetical protein
VATGTRGRVDGDGDDDGGTLGGVKMLNIRSRLSGRHVAVCRDDGTRDLSLEP